MIILLTLMGTSAILSGQSQRESRKGGRPVLKAVETSWVAYALRGMQSVGRSSLGNAANPRLMKAKSMDRFSEALLLDSSSTNCSRANRWDARRVFLSRD
jgi:hypothetical protein